MKNYFKKITAFSLVICMLLMAGLLIPFHTSASDYAFAEQRTDIYYSDLFYAYPSYLANDPYLASYQRSVMSLSNTIYGNYKGSLTEWLTALEYGLETATSLSNSLNFFSDLFGWSDYSYNAALDSANEYVVKELLSKNNGELLGRCENIAKSVETVVKYVNEGKKEYSNTIAYVQSTIEALKEHASTIFVEITPSKLDSLWNSISTNEKYCDMIEGISDGLTIAKALSVAIMMEDVRMEILDEVIQSQTENTVLKQGMTRLKNQLSLGFASNFCANYLGESFLLEKIIDDFGEFFAGSLLSKHVFLMFDIARIAVFDLITNPPEYKDILAFEVLREYSLNIHAGVGNATSIFDDGPFLSDEIFQYEDFFAMYIAINQATVELGKKIAKSSSPYPDKIYDFLKKNIRDNTTEIVLSTPNGETIKLDKTATSGEILGHFKAMLFSGAKEATIKVGYANMKFNLLDVLRYDPLSESAKENLDSINSFESHYANRNIYQEYINSVKSRIAAIPSSQRIRTDSTNWEFVFEDDRQLKLQSNFIEKNCFYTINNGLLGNVRIYGKNGRLIIPKDHKIAINGNVIIDDYGILQNNGELTITKDLSIDWWGNVINDGALRVTKSIYSKSGALGLRLTNNREIYARDFKVNGVEKYQATSNSKLYVSGSYEANFKVNCVIFNGSTQQNVKNLDAVHIIVENPKGLKYLSDTDIYGLYELRGNPLDLNGHDTLVHEGARFDNSDFHSIYVLHCEYTLYDNITADVKIYGGNGKLIIPKDHKIAINGNVMVDRDGTLHNKGTLTIKQGLSLYWNSSLTNDGNLTVIQKLYRQGDALGIKIVNNGDINVKEISIASGGSYQQSNVARLYVSGNYEANFKVQCVIFNGTTQQTVKNLVAQTVVLDNASTEGIRFASAIEVTALFDHRGNRFTLYDNGKKSTFVDYDGDGVKDHIDAYPTCAAHVWNEGELTKIPTHTTFGEKLYTCSECLATRTEQLAKVGDHTFGEWYEKTPPTCTAAGEKRRTCSECGMHEREHIDARGHDYAREWTVDIEPTCTEKGCSSRHCSRCDSQVDIIEIAENGHDCEEVVTPPTCTERGYTTHTCVVCGDAQTDTYVDALGHVYDHDQDETCNICGETREMEAESETITESGSDQPSEESSTTAWLSDLIDDLDFGCSAAVSDGIGMMLLLMAVGCFTFKKKKS